MPNLCLYFQVHQPYRLRPYSIFDIGHDSKYFNEAENIRIVQRIAQKCYLPANKLLLQLIREHNGRFKVAFAITGEAIEQFQKYAPEVLASFRALAMTGCVEFIAETYYHSLSSIYSQEEFVYQVHKHKELMQDLFDFTPTTFRNTELIYNDHLAKIISKMGFSTVLTEGVQKLLDWRSPNFVYTADGEPDLKLLMRNCNFSDDIAYRFSNRAWEEYPLTAVKYLDWIKNLKEQDIINIFMDYETFGEHHWLDSGIFNFLFDFVNKGVQRGHYFLNPREVAALYTQHESIDVVDYISWADSEKDLSAWTGNEVQRDALQMLYELEQPIKKLKDKRLLEDWRKLTAADHIYYMSTKHLNDGSIHSYFSPYQSPYDAFINFANVLEDLRRRIKIKKEHKAASPIKIAKNKTTKKKSGLSKLKKNDKVKVF